MSKKKEIKIYASYKGKPKEEIDSTSNIKDAQFLVQEYKTAYGPDFIIWAEDI